MGTSSSVFWKHSFGYSFVWLVRMICIFCKVEMIVSYELTREGEVYSDRFTCLKCGHWERSNFRFAKDYRVPDDTVRIVEDYLRRFPDAWDTLGKK